MNQNSLSIIDKLSIAEADSGRFFGWYVESSESTLAKLVEPQFRDMFWYSYKIIPLEGHQETLTADFWFPNCYLFRNCRYIEFTIKSFGHYEEGLQRVSVQGLCIPIKFNIIEKIWCLLRYKKNLIF